MWLLNSLFYIVAVLLIASSLIVVLAKKPMTSILAMIFAFINTSVLFLLLRAEFIAMVMLIVYVGAIAVLFVFIIMLLNVKVQERRKILTKSFVLGVAVAILVFIEIYIIIKSNLSNLPLLQGLTLNKDANNPYNLSLALYNNYALIVLLIGALLTIVVVGIVFINHQDDLIVNKQKMSNQVQRDKNKVVKTIKVELEEGIK